MRHRHGGRSRLSGVLLAALGALALLALPSVAAAKDRNHDHIPDRWEKRHHLSLKVNQAVRDQDRDGLDNRGEFRAGDNPRDDDSDNDGVMDGEENAGTIASFDAATGRLTIALFGGDTASGVVTAETEIRCGQAGEESSASASRDGENGDNSGPDSGEEEDHSGPGSGQMPPPVPGDDENDDPAGDNGISGANEGPGPDGNGDNQAAGCTTAALVVGATVDEAELKLRDGVATFTEVKLEQSDAGSAGTS